MHFKSQVKSCIMRYPQACITCKSDNCRLKSYFRFRSSILKCNILDKVSLEGLSGCFWDEWCLIMLIVILKITY